MNLKIARTNVLCSVWLRVKQTSFTFYLEETIKISVDATKCKFTEDRYFQSIIISTDGNV